MLSFTSSSIAIAFCISSVSPIATVSGLCTNIKLVGAMSTSVPAMAMTDAALAAMPSILTVTLPLYSISMV